MAMTAATTGAYNSAWSIRSLTRRCVMNTAEFLKQSVPLFKDFSAERLQQLVKGSRTASFEANEAIMHQGADATHFGVVLSGTVAASMTAAGGARQPIGQLRTGATFGEA